MSNDRRTDIGAPPNDLSPAEQDAWLEITRLLESDPSQALGDPYEHMTAARKVIWHELLALAPPGLLIRKHRIFMKLTCSCLDDLRERRRDAASPEGWKLVKSMLEDLQLQPAEIVRLMGPAPAAVENRRGCSHRGNKRQPRRSSKWLK